MKFLISVALGVALTAGTSVAAQAGPVLISCGPTGCTVRTYPSAPVFGHGHHEHLPITLPS